MGLHVPSVPASVPVLLTFFKFASGCGTGFGPASVRALWNRSADVASMVELVLATVGTSIAQAGPRLPRHLISRVQGYLFKLGRVQAAIHRGSKTAIEASSEASRSRSFTSHYDHGQHRDRQ